MNNISAGGHQYWLNLPPEYCNVSNKSVRQPKNEDIYNHLNEKEEREDSDNYDHACAATFDIEDSNLYNNVQSIKRIPVFFEESCWYQWSFCSEIVKSQERYYQRKKHLKSTIFCWVRTIFKRLCNEKAN